MGAQHGGVAGLAANENHSLGCHWMCRSQSGEVYLWRWDSQSGGEGVAFKPPDWLVYYGWGFGQPIRCFLCCMANYGGWGLSVIGCWVWGGRGFIPANQTPPVSPTLF